MSGFTPTNGEKSHYHLLHEATSLLAEAYQFTRSEHMLAEAIQAFLTQPDIKAIRGVV